MTFARFNEVWRELRGARAAIRLGEPPHPVCGVCGQLILPGDHVTAAAFAPAEHSAHPPLYTAPTKHAEHLIGALAAVALAEAFGCTSR